jgi:DNA uptake protein ComE-like DNA-binding protein
MFTKQFLSALAIIGLMSAPALAQTMTTAPVKPPVAAPVTSAPPVKTPAAVPATKKTNLNTATAKELDALPEVGKARSKVILDERAKSQFKDWADFDKRMTGTSVNAGVKAKIKDLVTF